MLPLYLLSQYPLLGLAIFYPKVSFIRSECCPERCLLMTVVSVWINTDIIILLEQETQSWLQLESTYLQAESYNDVLSVSVVHTANSCA